MILAAYAFSAPFAAAQSTDPNKILKGMSDYIVGQKSFSLTYDSAVEVITPELQKLQFTSSGEVDLNRPDKLRSKRTGGFSDVETVFDGKTFTVINKDNKTFAQLDAVGTVDQLIQLLRDKYAVSTPGSDLLFSNPFDVLTENAIDAKYFGHGVIDGVKCEHLAFRGVDTDWQIWIEVGARPIPRQYVITNKAVAGGPQYTVRIKEWKAGAPSDAFTFKPPAGTTKVALEALGHVDEIPPGALATGGKK
jgi:hypothetical protein